MLRPILKKTSYELWKGRKPNISYFHAIGSEYFVLNTKDKVLKFDHKSDLGVFLDTLLFLKYIGCTTKELKLWKKPYISPSKKRKGI